MMPSVSQRTLTWQTYVKTILPLGFIMATALALSNAAYLYLSVSYIQMLKSAGPISVYTLSCLSGLEAWRLPALLLLLGISVGIAGTSIGESHFNLWGFMLQLAAFFSDAIKLVLTKVMVSSKGASLDPLSALYYFVPVCCLGS